MNLMADNLQNNPIYGYMPLSTNVTVKRLEEEPLDFAKEVKDYANEALTGMSEEDWEEFEKLCKEYLEKHPIRTEADANAFKGFIKGLLEKLGFKGDVDEFCDGYVNLGKGETDINESVESSKDRTVKKMITEPDGKKYMLITNESGQTFKIRIPDEAEELDYSNPIQINIV